MEKAGCPIPGEMQQLVERIFETNAQRFAENFIIAFESPICPFGDFFPSAVCT